MDLGLQGKLVLITGGSRGIGLACARLFAAEGARLALCARDAGRLAEAREQLHEAACFPADLRDATAAADLVSRVEAQLGPIDVLVNCAGAARRTPAAELDAAAWHAAMDAKFFSYLHVIDPLIKRMAQRRSGVIVSVLGSGGKVAHVTHLAGGAANAALMLATAGLGAAYAPQGVRVVGVSPALTDTERVAEGMAARARAEGVSVADARRQSIAELPLGRMASPEEIAAAVVFAASARASYLTGTTIALDGALNPTVI
jgi:NAD(P)-dependent dehydrogenase (short-subunit alcohol dehydrogenase family)